MTQAKSAPDHDNSRETTSLALDRTNRNDNKNDNDNYNDNDNVPLRLRGGNGETDSIGLRGINPPSSSTHQPIIKRKNPESSPETVQLRNHFADIYMAITTARTILEEMVTVGKVGRKWNEMVSHQLDEVLISFRKVAKESASAIGQVTARRDDLRESQARNEELYLDIGAQRERIRVLEETVLTLKAQVPQYKNKKVVASNKDDMETDAIMVIDSPGSSGSSFTYAAIVSAPKPAPKKKSQKPDFPSLVTPVNRKDNIKSDTKNSRNKQTVDARDMLNSRSKRRADNGKGLKEKARKTNPTTHFVTTSEISWQDLRKSIEQKIRAPKLHTIKSRTGLILFPGNEETKKALNRTENLREIVPFTPRVMARGVESLLDPAEIPWALVNQNPELGLSEDDIGNIKPLYKLGPRDSHIVNWVLEVLPPTLQKVENKAAYIGMMRCKLKLWDKSPQCYKCQKFGHTTKTCRVETPICKKCAGGHDSRECTSENIKCANCKGNHQASDKSCKAKDLATRATLRRTDFNT